MDGWFSIDFGRQRLTVMSVAILVGPLGLLAQASQPVHVTQIEVTEAAEENLREPILESDPISLKKPSSGAETGLELPEADPHPISSSDPEPSVDPGRNEDSELQSGQIDTEPDVRADVIHGSKKPWTEFGHQAFSARVLAGFQPSDLNFENPPLPHVSKIQSVSSFTWVNPAARNQPTYFDDVDLERYGHAQSFQTVRSAFRFGKDIVMFPIEYRKNRDVDCVYQSGLARPGDAACPVKRRY